MAKSLRSTLRHAASAMAASDGRRSTAAVISQSMFFISLPSTQTSISLAPNQPSSHLTINSSEIAADIKDWFSSRSSALFDQIHRICSSSDDNPDAALSFLHLRLSEDFVLRLLHHHRHSDNLLPCLVFFDWAGRQPGFHHTRATYHAIFKILSRAKLMSVLLDWLHKFSTARVRCSTTDSGPSGSRASSSSYPSSMDHHLYRIRFYDTLIMGYAVAGRVDIALQLFGKMRFQGLDLNSFAYHVLLNSLVEERCFDMVQVLLHQIAARGYESLMTTCLKLKNLCRQNRVDEAENFLRTLAKCGEEVQEHMLHVVVDARCKQGRFDDARALAHEFVDANLSKTYALLISDLVQTGNLNSALDLFKSKRMEGFLPDLVCYNKLIHWLLNHNRLEEVYDLLAEMRQEGISPDKLTMNVVLCFFCKAGLTDVAVELYKSRLEIGFSVSNLTYSHLINALCSDGCVEAACTVMEESLKQGYFPSKMTFFILADKLCAEKKLDKMSKLVDMALRRHIMPSNAVWAKYISALCGGGRVEEAYQLPQVLMRPGFFFNKDAVYNLIRGFVELKRGDMASKLLIQVHHSGKTPPRKLFKAVIHCLCGVGDWESIRNLLENQLTGTESSDRHFYNCMIDGVSHASRSDFAEVLFSKMHVEGIAPSLRTKSVLLKCLIKSGNLDQAMSYFFKFAGMQTPSIKLYNTMIIGLCEVNRPNDALFLWMKMRQMGLVPSVQSYEELVKGLCLCENYQMVAKVFHDYEQTGRPVPSFMKGTLLLHSLKSREFMESWALEMIGELLSRFCRIVNSKNIKELIGAIEDSLEDNIFVYNLLLKHLNKDGRMDYSFAVFKLIQQKGIEPNHYSYDIMLQGFCAEGRVKDAKKWMEEMCRKGFCPSPYGQDLYNCLIRRS